MKEKKLLLLGPADSGKTSWFCPFEGIIPSRYIAGVVRDGRFAGHMVNEKTQVLFMDEWTSDSLCCEDAKKILQGGLLMLPQKHKEASKVIFKSPVFITTNLYPDLGTGADADAIRTRLAIFDTKPLPKKDTSVSGWLRLHCIWMYSTT